MRKLLFIYNPISGKGRLESLISDIVNIFAQSDCDVTVYPTQGKGDARDKAFRSAGGYDMIVCGGGDGTLDEVVSGMMSARVSLPLGYIPAGSTNDFAGSIEIPKNDILKAAEIAVSGTPFPCDVGSFNDDYFIYVAAFGIFTDVSYTTNQTLKNILGHLAYILEGTKRLANIPCYEIEAEAEGRKIKGRYAYGMVSNSTFVGGMKIGGGTEVILDDGLFEVMLIQTPQNPVMLNSILQALLLPKLAGSPYIQSFQAERVRIRSAEPIPWTLDGEFGGECSEVEIRSHRRRLTFMR